MRLSTLTFLAASCFVASFAKIETEDAVLVLTKDNIDEAIEQNEFILVEFYAPWCGHCKALAPEYAKAAKKLLETGSTIKLAKVDATIETELAEKHGVRGYPTIKYYRKGAVIDYGGGRKADDIINWLNKKSGPPAKDLPTVEEAKSFIEAHNVAIVGFFKDVESDGAKVFLNVANTVDDHAFGISSSDEVFSEYGVEDGKVILFKKFDEGKNQFEDELDVHKLRKFISVHALPLVVDFNEVTAEKIFNGDVSSHLLIFLSKEAGDYEKYMKEITGPVKNFIGKVLFVTINTDQSNHGRILEFFGIKKDEVPTMRIMNLDDEMAKYKPENPELSSGNIEEFVTGFVEGKLKRHLLTEDLPEDWDKTPVKVLVGTNFHEVAHNKEKNVLVQFYAPWCGHCQNLAPVYESLGEKFKDREDLVLAKMDATANEVEGVKISSYPTIILFKKETNEAVRYDDERTFEGLSKFIESDGAFGQPAEEAQEEDEDDDVPRKDEL